MAAKTKMWDYYKGHSTKAFQPISVKECLEMFVKDAPEFLEQFDWTMRRLDMETPRARAYHDWMVARNALGSHIEEIRKTYHDLIENPSEEKAEAFSDAMFNGYPALSSAKAIFWWNDFQKEHNGKCVTKAEK